MVTQLLHIVGSLGMFLYGMRTMSDGIQRGAGERLQSVLNFMTGNRIMALLTGLFITTIIQSSSATTVMVVSFVNAGLLQLTQAIGVIMGANIGTTVTGWIVAILGFKVKLDAIALPAIGVGFLLMVVKKLNKEHYGEFLVGFGLLFMGLGFLKDSVPDISKHPEWMEFLAQFTGRGVLSYFLFVTVGTIMTIIVQSSSAAMAITLTMAYAGWIDYPTAAAIVLGENIGTTVTAYIASYGTSVNARRASRAHTLFNIFGVLWMTVAFKPFLSLIEAIVPGDAWLTGANSALPAHLAMFHTLFNVANTLICMFFVNQIAAIVKLVVPDEKDEMKGSYRLKYISATLQDTPEFYLLTVKRELLRMVHIIDDMFARFLEVFSHPDVKMTTEVESQKQMEDYTDKMQEELTNYLSQCSLDNLNHVSAANVHGMMRITHELESIGDSCYNLMLLAQRRYDKHIEIDAEAIEGLMPYTNLVTQFIRFISSHLDEHITSENMAVARDLEKRINATRNTLKKAAEKRLQNGSGVKGELLYIDIVRHVEQIGDRCLNIIEHLPQVEKT